ncbi:MAG: tetratricopeptide repeat protein [Alphaproteobacteria bacterium]
MAGKPTPADLQQMLAAAVRHQAAGQLGEAAALCKRVLGVAPKHPAALHLLGLIEHRAGRSKAGAELISKAIALNPSDVAAQNNLGLVLLHMDRVDAARRQFEKALSLNPDYAEAINNLGTVQTRQGAPDAAEASFRKALDKKPAYPEALNNLGNVLAEKGAYEDATAQYITALKLRPGYADAMANLGNALTRLGRNDEAIDSCRAALAINPKMTKALINLGNALQEKGDLEQAQESYRQASEIDGKNALAFVNLGKVAQIRERFNAAVAAFQQACDLDPKTSTLCALAQSMVGARRSPEAESLLRDALRDRPKEAELIAALGVVLVDQSRMEEGIAAYREALSIDPGLSEAHNNLGTALIESGRLDEATACFRDAVRVNPNNASAHRHLALSRKFTDRDDDVIAMEDAWRRDDLTEAQQMLLGFGLGKIYDDMRRPDDAFPYFAKANAIRRKSLTYSIETEKENFERIAKVFDRDVLDRYRGAGADGTGQIFIVGMPRSGTTLVEQILSSHPQVFGAGEVLDLDETIERHFAVASDRNFAAAYRDPPREAFAAAGTDYIDAMRARAPDYDCFTNKMPANFIYLGLIALMLPGAKIVHCRRDPVDTCLSIFMRLFSTGQFFGYDQRELGRYYRLYRALMAHWSTVMPDRIHDIVYEDLVAEPETHTRALVGHCGLTWNDACLDFHTNKRTVKTASVAQVRQPIYKDSVQAWRRYEHHLQPLLDALGDAAGPDNGDR